MHEQHRGSDGMPVQNVPENNLETNVKYSVFNLTPDIEVRAFAKRSLLLSVQWTMCCCLQNLFCLELAPAFPGIQPFFVACAQICFSQQLICVSPCALEEVSADTGRWRGSKMRCYNSINKYVALL